MCAAVIHTVYAEKDYKFINGSSMMRFFFCLSQGLDSVIPEVPPTSTLFSNPIYPQIQFAVFAQVFQLIELYEIYILLDGVLGWDLEDQAYFVTLSVAFWVTFGKLFLPLCLCFHICKNRDNEMHGKLWR